jgi:hypothetical protein
MTKAQIIVILTRHGLVPDGQTAVERVRIPTARSPVFGGIGGEARDFGGRTRYAKPGTNLRVTVGPRTTNVYRVLGGRTEFVANLKTSDPDFENQLTKAVCHERVE